MRDCHTGEAGASYGSRYRSEVQDGRNRRGYERSPSPGQNFASENPTRSNQIQRRYLEHEIENGEIFREPKRVTYYKEERQNSRGRLSEMNRINSTDSEKQEHHNGQPRDFAKKSYTQNPECRAAPDNSRPYSTSSLKCESRKRIYSQRGSDASYSQGGRHLCNPDLERGRALSKDGSKWAGWSTS